MKPTKTKLNRFSPRTLLTPKDYKAFVSQSEEVLEAGRPLNLLAFRVGLRWLGRVLLSGLGWALAGYIQWAGRRIQAARLPHSPFFWLRQGLRFGYKWSRRAQPLAEAQAARLQEAAEKLHHDAQSFVLKLDSFQARLPHNWVGQYTAFGDVAFRAGADPLDVDLIRHEWAHYWWGHHLTGQQRTAFVQAVEALAQAPDVGENHQYAQELARAFVEARDANCQLGGGRKWVVPLQSNDGYRVAYCFDLIATEVYAYTAQLSRAELNRVPDALHPFYAGFLND